MTHMPGYVRSWITPALARMRSEIKDEVENALLKEIPQSSEWTEINLCQKTPRIIAMVTGRIIVGLDLCRSATYIEIATEFTKEVMATAISITLIPLFLRPLMVPILPQLWLTRRRIVQAEEVLGPTITSRWLQPQNQNRTEQVDILQLMIEASENCGRGKKDLVVELLFLNIGAVHSTAMTITHASVPPT
ncbi:unnamed protein product [Clonostachys byssicola]|uniref:Uncharacterized protein n=1 Tax=Clonostachys byssicola TaxID=160290 RepID=A0A9N9Y0Z3_9HYPO|nr:unnamed protein product [Clonostachys byssicola]